MPSIIGAIGAGWSAFKKAYLSTSADPTRISSGGYGAAFGDRVPRALRYAVYWAAYENTLYDGQNLTTIAGSAAVNAGSDTHPWAGSFKTAMGLYRYTRGVLNPVYRLVEFHATHIHGGELDPFAGDGSQVPSALPILDATDAHRKAIARLWRDSNWQIAKDLNVRFGAAKGDTFLAVADRHEDGRVYLEVIPAEHVAEVTKDAYGNVKGYVLEHYRDDPTAPPRTMLDLDSPVPQVVYTMSCERDDAGPGVTYRTYKDRRPFAWDGMPAEWTIPYGFVPLWHIQHIPTGLGWGWPEAFSGLAKFCESDEQASKLDDAVRKLVETTWLLSGVTDLEMGAALAKYSPSAKNPQPGRNESLTINTKDPASKAHPLVAPVNVSDVTGNLRFLVEQHLQDYPELRYELIRASGDANAKALTEARKPVESKIRQRRVSYDAALLKAMQGALAIAGWRHGLTGDARLADYAGFGLESYDHGDLGFRIGVRPVFDATPADEAEDDTIQAARVKAWVDAGVPLALALKRAKWSAEDIAQVTAEEERKAKEAEARLAAMAERVPGQGSGQEEEEEGDEEVDGL